MKLILLFKCFLQNTTNQTKQKTEILQSPYFKCGTFLNFFHPYFSSENFSSPPNADTFGKAISPVPLYEGGSFYVEAK